MPTFRATIRQAKELLETGKAKYCVSKCSTNISSSGEIKFTRVSYDWEIFCPDLNGGFGRTFAATPNEIVTVHN